MFMKIIYAIPKSLNFSEGMLKQKLSSLRRFCNFAILYFCLVSA